ncbi:MAG TPA: TIM-barrel domain-containing protein [Vicinamibacterales bacterium]|nr:TIM-barrel domain-containing protein [Vicinamibacterales bacterium]
MREERQKRRFGLVGKVGAAGILAGAALSVLSAQAPSTQTVLDRDGSTVVVEPYAPNIVRVTLSTSRDEATAAPGYGFDAKPSAEGWTREHTDQGDVDRSSRLVVTVAANRPQTLEPTMADITRYFVDSVPPAHITIATPDGAQLVDMTGWSMSVPNNKDGNASLVHDLGPKDKPFYRVSATFFAPPDEHYYGLGQNQEGFLDHRGHVVNCAQSYQAPAAPSVCVPFVVTNRGYGLIWDNPSKTSFEPGFHETTKWVSQVGNRVSFFVIAGRTTDEIYAGYRTLTGPTPMLPKGTYGYIQSKQRYRSQDEVLSVAKGYRDRHLPIDVMVVDWFYYTKMGQMDFDPRYWPDPAAMNRQLHDMGFHTMISIWPRFEPGSRYYDFLRQHDWFERRADGTPTDGLPYDRAGSDIDTTNPDAAQWYWNMVRDNILSKGFDYLWADETEPDLPPDGSYFHIGPGTRYFNVYPLFHTSTLYDGFRRDVKGRRALILSRDAYLGAQRNGTFFWSSDIYPTWDTLKRQIPTGLDFTASGLAYWTNDIGGWQYLPAAHHPAHPPLLDPSDARDVVGGYDDYPELYTRWFEYATFLPILRAHGSRPENEVWSYGKQAEPILTKYLKLRYALLPYIYSLAHHTYETGAPYMRALFMDFPNDPNVIDRRYEYMFGPAFLVAPVYEQGQTSREVYLPAGTDWYNYWTNERLHGGQTVTVNAPIDTLPLFVRAGSIVPFGSAIENTTQSQRIEHVRVYAGADADFALYQDDGETYAYETGGSSVTSLHWNDVQGQLTHEGAAAWAAPDSSVVEVIGK